MGPTIEEFASEHQLPLRWVELRNTCNRLVERADFWYRADLRNAARPLAVEASDILLSSLKRRGRSPQGGMPQACPQDVDETIGSGYESADRQQIDPRKSKELSFTRTDKAQLLTTAVSGALRNLALEPIWVGANDLRLRSSSSCAGPPAEFQWNEVDL